MALSESDKQILKDAKDIILRETEAQGSKLQIFGFGTFERRIQSARTATSPADGSKVDVPAKSVFKFKASKTLTHVL